MLNRRSFTALPTNLWGLASPGPGSARNRRWNEALHKAICPLALLVVATAAPLFGQGLAQWVPNTSNPNQSILFKGGGNVGTLNGDTEFVCRGTPPAGGTHPGKFYSALGKCFIEFAGAEIGLTTFELLTDFSGIWVPASGGSIPKGAFVAGSESGLNFFSCRAFLGGGIEMGKIRSDFKACNIGLNGGGFSISNYEVLVNPWVPSTGADVPSEFLAGNEPPPDSQQLFLCRASFSGGIHVGKFRSGIGCAIGFANQGVQVNTFEVLTNAFTGIWLPASNGTVPAGAFRAGREASNNSLTTQFACRASQGGGVHPGKLLPGQAGCQIQFGFANGQLQQVLVPNYEVLIPTPPIPSGPFKIHTKATGKSWVEGSNQIISTLTQPDDATARYTFQPQADGSFRLIVQSDQKELHEDGCCSKLLSTRFQPHDDFTLFFFEQQADIGSYRMRTKADNLYLAEGADGQISTLTQLDNDNARILLEPTTLVAGTPKWGITLTHSGNFTQGQNGATYTITVTNTGTAATGAGNAQVSDTLPAGLTAVSIQGTGWTCQTSPTIGCNRSDSLAAGASYPVLTLTVNVAASAPASVTNQVSVSGAGATGTSATDPTTITVSGTPAWSIISTHSGNFTQGQNGAVYTITVANTGTAATTGVGISQFFDTLPAGLTAVSIQGTGWLCQVTPTIGCNRSDVLAAGSSYPPLTLTVNVAANAPASVTNQVSISGGGAGSATGTDPTTIIASGTPAWTITKTHPGNFTQGQNGAVYTITTSNSGNGTTSGGTVQVVDNLPAGLTAIAIQGTGWSCQTSPSVGCNRSDPLTAGASYPPITLTVNVAPNAPASVTNQVSISGGNAPSTASATDPTTIISTNLTLLPSSLPAATVSVAYSAQVTVSGGTSPFSFSLASGNLPTGLNLSFNGLISGTPTQAGSFTFTVQTKDANNATGQIAYTITVAAKAPTPVITSVLNGASFVPGGAIVSGSWVSIFGTALAPDGTARAWNTSTEILNGKFPLSLDGTSVTVNGKPAAVEFIQPTQVNIQVPDDTAVGPVQVVVTTPAGASNSFTVNYSQFAPGLFPANAPYVVAQHSDNSYVTPAAPAKPGEVIILWGTGFGPGNPAVASGQVFSGASKVANTVTATIGGQPALIDFAGIVGAGLVQINVHVPTSISGGDVAVVTSVGGVSSQATSNLIPVKN